MFQAVVKRIAQRGMKGVLHDLAPAFILLFVSCFMFLFFEPILVYATNVDYFWFDFHTMIWPVLIIFAIFFLAGFIAILAAYAANLLITNRLLLYKGIVLAGFVVFFLLYFQGNWLSGNLPPLVGSKIAWENYGRRENLILIVSAVVLIVAVFLSIKNKGLDRTIFYSAACTSVVFVMLSAALIATVLTNNALDSRDDSIFFSIKNYNTISSNKNFLILLLDATESQACYDVMMGDDDFREMMEDFTYYPDTLSVYQYTKYSLPNIFTGMVSRLETNYQDYSSNAYNQSAFFEKLVQNGYEINLYSDPSFFGWGMDINYDIENAIPMSDLRIKFDNFMRLEIKYDMFKYLPYGLKRLSGAPQIDFSWCKDTGSASSEYVEHLYSNVSAYEYITENSILDKQSNNYFQFIHCQGGHPPYDTDKDLNAVKDGTYEQQIAASLTVVKAYLQRLKDNNAYDNSVIVILADHGSLSNYEEYDQEGRFVAGRFNPILFIKGINETHEMLVSDRSVSFTDLQGAFCDLIDGKQSAELFPELEPGRTRKILWHTSTNYQMIEYSTTGTASEAEKFTPTGNIYDVQR